MLLGLEFCSFVELIAQFEEAFSKTVDSIRLVAFDLFFSIGPDLINFFDILSEPDSHLMNFIVSFLVEILLFFQLRSINKYL